MTEFSTDIYIGTYYSEESRGIYRALLDTATGRMTEPELFYEAPNAKWVSLDGRSMALPVERQGRAGTCFLELRDGSVAREAEILEEKQTPCYILQRDGYVYTANYHEGNVMVYHIEGGNPTLVKRIESGARAGCHQILMHGDDLMVPCLEQDRIRIFDTLDGYAPVGEIRFPEGTGPRHGVFNRDHSRFYVVSEWSNQLFVFAVKGRVFELTESLSLLPEGFEESGGKAASAAVRLTADERFLYVSVRDADLLAVLAVSGERAELIQHVPCGGKHPRDMILSGDERFLLVVNRFEGGIVSMERDPQSGLLGQVRHRVPMREGVALALEEHKQEVIL